MCADESDGSWDCRDVSDKGKLKFTDTVIYVLLTANLQNNNNMNI
jgi:hypothetical protein